MITCQGCGGILGRDCWNESDCVSISRNNEYDYSYLQSEVQRMQSEIDNLQMVILTLNHQNELINHIR